MKREVVVKHGEKLRCGYTTGSCATAAAVAAVELLVTGRAPAAVSVVLPDGESVLFTPKDAALVDGRARCAVLKDAGDDPDVTHGATIACAAQFGGNGITLRGGSGVGIVCVNGLQCAPGEAAINPTPRRMIVEQTMKLCNKYGVTQGIILTVEVENGQELAKKTFNERLGIKGGISILGTTGRVEPMSEKALVDTIQLLLKRRYLENPKRVLLSPGNYGVAYCKSLGFDLNQSVKISNYVGEALDYCRYLGFKEILLVGHTGKLVKLAGGIMNTHSHTADCRMELIALQAARCGASTDLLERLLQSVTTDEAFDHLAETVYYNNVKEKLLERIQFHLNYRLQGDVQCEVMLFSTDGRHTIKSENALSFGAYFGGNGNEG